MNKAKIKKAATITGAALGLAFIVMRKIAKHQMANDKYRNDQSEQNPMYKKRVVFIEDDNDPVNADGKRGHLEAVGISEHIQTFYEKYIKRALDIILSFCGMVVLAPVYAMAAIAIKIDDPGPVIFKQKRISEQTGYFDVLKFRSMRMDTPRNMPTHQLSNPDQYLLRTGKLIRKCSIDELPQLWNCFVGSMSIIGPRPALWNQDYLTAERDKYGANDIKPGLTGLAQVHGRDELEIPDKAKLDGEYAAALKKSSWSGLKMDIKVFVDSVKAVLKSDGVVEGGTGEIHKQEENEKVS
ncbi:sugar transferase [Ruminococcus albus]|uniref:Sugar transferase n=1 Tax=Ruminococcus albus (strain ATCC 27210 / DSM 20455 / JCM 14654 / NCDO 2250 / 7) TaxID=697329 RepID=E6UK38_RUMA7|nr:sugar transferase [Ruminococcus albus]ADU24034.1 sugar transferase [Ruminococcus albus 7 = DSM 20455]